MPRHKPYTYEQIMQEPCFRCGKPSFFQWQICSDNNIYRPICPECDIELQHVTLDFMNVSSNRKARLIYYYNNKVRRQLKRYEYLYSIPSLNYYREEQEK